MEREPTPSVVIPLDADLRTKDNHGDAGMLRKRLQDVIHIISIQREALDAPGPRDGYQGTVASVKDDVDDAGLFIAAPTLVVIIVLMLSVVLVLMAMSMLAFPFALIVIIIVVIMPVRPHAINDAFRSVVALNSVVAGLNGRVLQAGKLCRSDGHRTDIEGQPRLCRQHNLALPAEICPDGTSPCAHSAADNRSLAAAACCSDSAAHCSGAADDQHIAAAM